MRIAMVTSQVSRHGAGVAGAVEGLSRSLSNLGHEVRVFALEDAAWREDSKKWGGAPVTTLSVRGPRRLGYAPDMVKALTAFAPDVAHLHGLWMLPSMSVERWSRNADRPYMISPHGMLAPEALAFSPLKKRIAGHLYQNRCFRGASALHATSEDEARQICNFGLDQPIALYPNGIDIRNSTSDGERRKLILSLGRLHPVKGLDVLVDAWARLAPKFPDWHLRIVGPDTGDYAADLRRQANKLGVCRFEISGAVYDDAKYQLLNDASVFVLPSRSENFGLTVVESLMMGTPVVASHGTPWASLEGQGCGLWVPGEASAFAEAMAQIMDLPEAARREMGSKGKAWVQEAFSWRSVAGLAHEAYEAMRGEI